jgi:acyl-coenzyme A synthetase/AMP-(fatty) acid ligase
VTPPFNACDYLLDRHIREGRGDRLALTGVAGGVSYADLAERVEYPTTATGKIRRVELRAQAAVILQGEPELAPEDKVPL